MPLVPGDLLGGYFKVARPELKDLFFGCLANNGYWEHVAVTVFTPGRRPDRCPTWEEMCYIKSLFWEDEEKAIQLHPPKSEWVNNHPYCLHLWRPKHIEIPRPPSILVGVA